MRIVQFSLFRLAQLSSKRYHLNQNEKIRFNRSWRHNFAPSERLRRIFSGAGKKRATLGCDATVYLRQRSFILQRSSPSRN